MLYVLIQGGKKFTCFPKDLESYDVLLLRTSQTTDEHTSLELTFDIVNRKPVIEWKVTKDFDDGDLLLAVAPWGKFGLLRLTDIFQWEDNKLKIKI